MADIGVGVAGYGNAGRYWHATLIHHTPGLELRAVFSRSEERRSQAVRELGVSAYSTYAALLADPTVELVVVATPHDTHARLAIAAIEAGKHVVVEKIMCLSVAEGNAMIAASRRSGTVLSIFQCRRWDSDFLTVRSVLDDGLLGDIYAVESCVTSYTSPKSTVAPRPWRSYAAHGGGPLRDWGAHLLDQAVVLFGASPQAVFADCQYRQPEWDVETAAQVWMRYRNGVRFSIEMGAISAIAKPRWYIRGSRGALIQYGRDPQQQALLRRDVGPRPLDPADIPRVILADEGKQREVFPPVTPGNYPAFYANVREAVHGRAPLEVQPEDVLSSVRLIEAAAAAARRGSVVSPSP